LYYIPFLYLVYIVNFFFFYADFLGFRLFFHIIIYY